MQRRRSVCWQMTRLKEWTSEEVRARAFHVSVGAEHGTRQHPEVLYTVAVYGAYVMSVQQVRKWCRDFADGRVSVTDEDLSGHPATANTFVSDINERVRAHSRVSPKQLELACIVSHGIV